MLPLQDKYLQSVVRRRGKYFLCKLARGVVPIPDAMFRGFEQLVLAGSDVHEDGRSPTRPLSVGDPCKLRCLERQLCQNIEAYFVEKPDARRAIEEFRGEMLDDAFEMAIEAIQWSAEGVYELHVVDTAGIAPGVAIITRGQESASSREGLIIPSDDLKVIRFLDGRIVFGYQDGRSLHVFTDTGAWHFYPPLHAAAVGPDEQSSE
jgi:hypothetical protein